MRLALLESKDINVEVYELLKKKFEIKIYLTLKVNLNLILKEFDIVWLRLGHKFEDDDFEGKLRCKYIVCPVTGINHLNPEMCNKKEIKIISLKNQNQILSQINSTAEHTILLTLAILRKFRSSIKSIENTEFNRDQFRGNDLSGKVVGVIGLGRLGKMVSDYFYSFGCEVIGYDINKKIQFKYKKKQLTDLVKTSDIISIHVDLNQTSKHLIDKYFFENTKNNCLIINTSRGEIINSIDLIDALKNKKIGGAALDVLKMN